MAGITYHDNIISKPLWAAESLRAENLLPGPYQLDPTLFPSADSVKVAPSGAAAIGATSVSVAALSDKIPVNTLLDFGYYSPVLVTVADASISAGDTSITVSALPGPLPAGAVLDFGGGTNAQLVKLSAAAAAAATTITVYPVDGTVANSSTYTWLGGRISAYTTAEAAKAATSITVAPLQFALATTDTAYYSYGVTQRIPGGILVGRTYTERAAGTAFGPWAASDDEVYLIAFDVMDAVGDPTFTALRPNVAVFENYLPDFADTNNYTSGKKAALRAAYRTQIGLG